MRQQPLTPEDYTDSEMVEELAAYQQVHGDLPDIVDSIIEFFEDANRISDKQREVLDRYWYQTQ